MFSEFIKVSYNHDCTFVYLNKKKNRKLNSYYSITVKTKKRNQINKSLQFQTRLN